MVCWFSKAKGEERVHKVDGVLMRANPKGLEKSSSTIYGKEVVFKSIETKSD
jgi:hypothetical protein